MFSKVFAVKCDGHPLIQFSQSHAGRQSLLRLSEIQAVTLFKPRIDSLAQLLHKRLDGHPSSGLIMTIWPHGIHNKHVFE